MKKRIGALLLALLLLVTATACANQSGNDPIPADPPEDDPRYFGDIEDPEQDDQKENTPKPETPKNDQTDESKDNADDTDLTKDQTYDPDSWINPGDLSTPYAIANAAAKASPSVVAITTEVVSYGGFYGNYVSEGAGSGVIYSDDGYIITNNHVIEDAKTVRVTLVNGDTYDAEVIGADTVTDIAVLKISATGLLAANPSTEALVVGQPVIAIGNPMGTLSGTVTSGIVSCLSRLISVEGVAMELLQFDAAVSPGNSGGGLFDLNGNLIAVVNAKSSGEGVEGISFAIPVARAADIARQFIENGYIAGRPSLGVSTECITTTNYESYRDSELWEYAVVGNSLYSGLYITDAEGVEYVNSQNTFQFGDSIAKIDDLEIQTDSDLEAALSRYKVGDTVTVTVARLTLVNTAFGNRYTYKGYDVTVKLSEKLPSADADDGDTSDDNKDNGGSSGGTVI